jgi:hypothetical protein
MPARTALRRALLAESRFEDDASRTVMVPSAPGLRTESGLTRLATSVADAAVNHDGETRIDDRPALTYRVPRTGLRAVA